MAARKKSEAAERRAQMAAVADKFENWMPAGEALTRIKAVPTRFPQVDVATKVDGWPIERLGMLHGPSSEGKTAFALGLGDSFLTRDHFFGLVDAEFTTSIDWPEKLMGSNSSHPGFRAVRPRSYENTVAAVREFVTGIADAREKKKLDEDTSAILVVDSLQKLVPQNLLATLEKAAVEKGNVDGMKGMAGMIQAAFNAAWLKELIPLLYFTRTALVLISRESQRSVTKPWEQDYKIGGGNAPYYDSSLVCRITRSFVKGGDSKDDPVVGERHLVRITKSKVGGKEGKYTDAFFHTSNGVGSPFGFDLARDVFEMAEESGVVAKSNEWIDSVTGTSLGRGREEAMHTLRGDPVLLDAVKDGAKRAFKPTEGEAP